MFPILTKYARSTTGNPFQCPDCLQGYYALNILLKHFGHDLRLVYRHFPLREVHPDAELAAEAAEAAGAQGHFHAMHRLLFEHQQHLKLNQIRGYAERLELDLERYDSEMSDELYLQRVREQIESGRHSGVRATPTFFVNGRIADVSFGLQSLSAAVEAALHR